MSAKGPVPLGPWPLGANDVANRTELKPGELREAVNVVLTDKSTVRRRPGFRRVLALADPHSLWRLGRTVLFVAEGQLQRLVLPTYEAAPLVVLTQPARRMSYAEVNGEVWFTNGADSGVVNTGSWRVRPWAVPAPGAPRLSTVPGGLPSGTYAVVAVAVNEAGEESAASPVTALALDGSQALRVDLAANDTAGGVRLYITPPDGDRFYYAATVPYGMASWAVGGWEPRAECKTRFLEPMPVGDIVRYYRGRLWVIDGRRMVVSEPLRYGLTRSGEGFFTFAVPPVVLEPVLDGLYIVAGHTYFYGGETPEAMVPRLVSPYGAVPGTGMRVNGTWFTQLREPLSAEAAYWYGDEGAVVGGPGGRLVPLMENRIAGQAFAGGASFVRQHDGVRQVGTVLSQPGPQSAFRAVDSATAVIKRNGVVVG